MAFTWYDPRTWGQDTKEEQYNEGIRGSLQGTAFDAGQFANLGQQGYQGMNRELDAAQADLRARAAGQKSVSAEQLRQGLQQQLAQQKSLAAGAGPNAAMNARNAANNMARASYGLSGQQAVAGLAEQQMAIQQLGQMLGQRRGQDMQVALGSRQNQTGALHNALNPLGDRSAGERYAGAFGTAIGAAGRMFGGG